jgi:hypothetical protein
MKSHDVTSISFVYGVCSRLCNEISYLIEAALCLEFGHCINCFKQFEVSLFLSIIIFKLLNLNKALSLLQ